jgi:hypothetical protein
MDIGGRIHPWRIEQAQGEDRSVSPLDECRDTPPPLVLRNPDGFEGLAFRDAVTLEIEVGEPMAAAGFPFPHPGSRTVTQEDYPAIIASIRKANAEEFGEGADRP